MGRKFQKESDEPGISSPSILLALTVETIVEAVTAVVAEAINRSLILLIKQPLPYAGRGLFHVHSFSQATPEDNSQRPIRMSSHFVACSQW